ncbi:porin family protein [Parachryseolinea silvisoli]|jgi:hypothetical protein|uniref:porin family protein n=1 Tax=Parachryseolinea silvisoli TaxID=2873601 RepID=UPI0022658782|nr:porin family protein [Parachryseolinea silvisoli]MCD9018356.1 PorT family protein [Parachryseolinea silvisoli]
MKKLFLTVAAVALCTATLFAQISIGAKAGVNLANVNGDDVDEADMRIGFHVGGYLNVAFSDALSLQPELLFNSVGYKTSEEIAGDDYDVTTNLNYLSIPVNLMYSFGAFNVHAGPQLGLLMSAKLKSSDVDELDGEDVKDFYKSSDLGFNVGIGGNFGKLNATARYTLGLSNIADDDDADVKNGVIQISLGYKIFGGD